MKGKIKEFFRKNELKIYAVAGSSLLIFSIGYLIGINVCDKNMQEALSAAADLGFSRGRTNGQILAWAHAFMADKDATRHLLSFYNKPEDLNGVMSFLEQVTHNQEFQKFNELYDMIPKDPSKI